MDDSKEGDSLFNLFNEKHRKKIRDTFSTTSRENLEVFVGSFVTANSIGYGDDLIWRTYGKHNGEEKAGCALAFDKEQHFPDRPLPLMKLLETLLWLKYPIGKAQNEIVTKKECYLYPVYYEPEKIQGEVDKLDEVLVKLCNKKYKETCKIVAILLNYVRYLFKHETYQREKEYRITILRARESLAVKEEAVKPPRRTYVECSLDMKEVAVLLGPETKKATTWEQWLNRKDSFKEIKPTNK